MYDLPRKDFLLYNSIVSCISKDWKLKLKSETVNASREKMLIEQLLKTKHSNKYLYNLQLSKEIIINNRSEAKWDNELNRENAEWNKIYMVPIICTIDIKLREFQYKYLQIHFYSQ